MKTILILVISFLILSGVVNGKGGGKGRIPKREEGPKHKK